MIRCSQLGQIMTNPRLKSETLSETAKAVIEDLVKESIFDVQLGQQTNKYCEKGNQTEDACIDLLSELHGIKYEKHFGRVTSQDLWLTRECDILLPSEGRDIKSAWSIETFPMTADKILKDKSAYEWQMRGYMLLYDREQWWIDYCLVDTPDDLCKFEPVELHFVSHLPARLRVTSAMIKRDLEIERQIVERLQVCREYFEELKQKVLDEHR